MLAAAAGMMAHALPLVCLAGSTPSWLASLS